METTISANPWNGSGNSEPPSFAFQSYLHIGGSSLSRLCKRHGMTTKKAPLTDTTAHVATDEDTPSTTVVQDGKECGRGNNAVRSTIIQEQQQQQIHIRTPPCPGGKSPSSCLSSTKRRDKYGGHHCQVERLTKDIDDLIKQLDETRAESRERAFRTKYHDIISASAIARRSRDSDIVSGRAHTLLENLPELSRWLRRPLVAGDGTAIAVERRSQRDFVDLFHNFARQLRYRVSGLHNH